MACVPTSMEMQSILWDTAHVGQLDRWLYNVYSHYTGLGPTDASSLPDYSTTLNHQPTLTSTSGPVYNDNRNQALTQLLVAKIPAMSQESHIPSTKLTEVLWLLRICLTFQNKKELRVETDWQCCIVAPFAAAAVVKFVCSNYDFSSANIGYSVLFVCDWHDNSRVSYATLL